MPCEYLTAETAGAWLFSPLSFARSSGSSKEDSPGSEGQRASARGCLDLSRL